MDEVDEVDEVDEEDEVDEVDEVDKVDEVDEVGRRRRPPPASRGQSPGSAGDSVVPSVQRGMATVQEYGTDAELLLSVFVHKKQ